MRAAGWRAISGGPRGAKRSTGLGGIRWCAWPVSGTPDRFVLDRDGWPVDKTTRTWPEVETYVREHGGG